jgi:hypothetical protein
LGLAAPDAGEPAPRVKQRMLAAFRRPGSARPHNLDRAARRRRWAAVFASAAAAALLIGLGSALVSLQTSVNQQQARLDA